MQNSATTEKGFHRDPCVRHGTRRRAKNSERSTGYTTIRRHPPLNFPGGISRMRYLLLVCLLLGTFTWGQQIPARTTVPPEFHPPVTDGDDDEAPPTSAS